MSYKSVLKHYREISKSHYSRHQFTVVSDTSFCTSKDVTTTSPTSNPHSNGSISRCVLKKVFSFLFTCCSDELLLPNQRKRIQYQNITETDSSQALRCLINVTARNFFHDNFFLSKTCSFTHFTQ